ncbi:DJ-1/PfpI family protein [Rhodophyticola sp. CCM32]|uniref:DJ-1/PfpI family protein n=1 Tax=Rhodophyticola sp. CCM32 TaxID=2916397 RepID=UPI00107F5094|nr:DJ-1/PfpI family protein [Rhodophyticola sp. CCM32]QBX99379.1 DJ-1/PfpI family protein [Rhodophyticola sp. CCM32]
MNTRIGILAFPNITQLNLTGPYEVFSRLPNTRTDLVWKSTDPVLSDTGFTITPTLAFADAPEFDVILVPGGVGQQGLLEDTDVLHFIRQQAKTAKWVMSTCTGSLVLGAAGLLDGKRATCHWLSLPLLRHFGCIIVEERVVFDGQIISAAGVSAGIDGALELVDRLAGRDMAETIQLSLEYDPQPPYSAGSPATARPELSARIRKFTEPIIAGRDDRARAAAARLTEGVRDVL